MKKMNLIIFCSFIFVAAAAKNDSELLCGLHNVNSYVDDFMQKVCATLNDTIPLPDEGYVIKMHNGQFYGLNTVKRTGQATITCTANTVTIKFPFQTVDPIRARYDWETKLIMTKLRGVSYARAGVFEAKAEIKVPSSGSGKKGPAQIVKLDVIKMKDIEISVSGLAHISWLWSKSVSKMANLFDAATSLVAKEKLRTIMNNVLANVDLYSY